MPGPANSIRRGACALLGAGLLLASGTLPGAAPQIVGYVETVRLYPGGLDLRAKLDTGALHSSLNAESMTFEPRDGATWVRFGLINSAGAKIEVEQPVLRTATIRRHNDRRQERPVVMLGICLGSVYKEVEVNLIDRSGFNYQILVGRSFLREDFLVDATRSHKINPVCEGASGTQKLKE